MEDHRTKFSIGRSVGPNLLLSSTWK